MTDQVKWIELPVIHEEQSAYVGYHDCAKAERVRREGTAEAERQWRMDCRCGFVSPWSPDPAATWNAQNHHAANAGVEPDGNGLAWFAIVGLLLIGLFVGFILPIILPWSFK